MSKGTLGKDLKETPKQRRSEFSSEKDKGWGDEEKPSFNSESTYESKRFGLPVNMQHYTNLVDHKTVVIEYNRDCGEKRRNWEELNESQV